jgi:hypothetical protein
LALAVVPVTAAAAGPLEPVACAAPTAGAAVGAAAEAALAAWAAMDSAAFLAGSDGLREALPCLADVVPASAAAAVFRVEGLRAFGERDLEATARWLAAARVAAPAEPFPVGLVAETHPLAVAARTIDTAAGRYQELPAGAGGRYYVDGAATSVRPLDWPSIVQVTDHDGVVWKTAMVTSADLLPALPAPPVDARIAPVATVPTAGRQSARGARVGFAATAGTAAIASGLLYAWASSSSSAYWDDNTPTSSLDDLRGQTNRRAVASLASGGVAAAATAGLVLSLSW